MGSHHDHRKWPGILARRRQRVHKSSAVDFLTTGGLIFVSIQGGQG
jgi:hypothetical protein